MEAKKWIKFVLKSQLLLSKKFLIRTIVKLKLLMEFLLILLRLFSLIAETVRIRWLKRPRRILLFHNSITLKINLILKSSKIKYWSSYSQQLKLYWFSSAKMVSLYSNSSYLADLIKSEVLKKSWLWWTKAKLMTMLNKLISLLWNKTLEKPLLSWNN